MKKGDKVKLEFPNKHPEPCTVILRLWEDTYLVKKDRDQNPKPVYIVEIPENGKIIQ